MTHGFRGSAATRRRRGFEQLAEPGAAGSGQAGVESGRHHLVGRVVQAGEPARRTARLVEIDDLASSFLSGFATAARAPAYMMENVTVRWAPAAEVPS